MSPRGWLHACTLTHMPTRPATRSLSQARVVAPESIHSLRHRLRTQAPSAPTPRGPAGSQVARARERIHPKFTLRCLHAHMRSDALTLIPHRHMLT